MKRWLAAAAEEIAQAYLLIILMSVCIAGIFIGINILAGRPAY